MHVYPELFVPIALLIVLQAHTCHLGRMAPQKEAANDARMIHYVAAAYAIDHPNEPCPTLQALIDHNEIDRSSKRTDPWNRPYRTECTADDVRVRSAGPDGKIGTADDIVIPATSVDLATK